MHRGRAESDKPVERTLTEIGFPDELAASPETLAIEINGRCPSSLPLAKGVATPLQIKLAVDAANENAARGQFSPIEFVMARPKQRLSGSFETHQRMLCGRR